ncbi:MAG: isocitrate lyase/phosphoenolpyruvate mutase family protein [Solirubrobacteraceae bacterium]
MSTQADRAERFLALHRPGAPLLMPNPWDAGSAKLLTWLGFEALATTSGGFAVTLGRRDGSVARDEALSYASAIVQATELPVSADFENAYADDPDGVAQTVRLGIEAGLAGCSVEDYTGRDDEPFYELEHAKERVIAAAEAAHRGAVRLVLTARAENHLRGRDDIADTIARLQAYQEAGADVLFAAALTDREHLRQLISSVDLPLSVIARPGSLPVAELAALGASRISVGPALLFNAFGALVEAARELRDHGTYSYHERGALGAHAVREAFGPEASDPSDTLRRRRQAPPTNFIT